MRLIMNYFISTKVPYSEWPEIVHTFLQKQGLSNKRFLYYFETLLGSDPDSDGYRKEFERGGCSRMLKDCPELGPMKIWSGEKYGHFDHAYLSNIGVETFPEKKILPLMKKIHRSYALSQSDLYYYDIDFFHDLIPYERDYSDAERHCSARGLSVDREMLLPRQPYGSGICLHRERFFGGHIQLSVDLLHDGNLLDAQPYCDALCELLPDATVLPFMVPYFSEEEKDDIEVNNRRAAPMLKQCQEFFAQYFTDNDRQNAFRSNYAIAPTLKKLCKQYGYVYTFPRERGFFCADKRSKRNHLLSLEVDAGPSRYSMDVVVSFRGLGFEHRLGYCMHTPTDQETADDCMRQVMETFAVFEKTLFPFLDAMFPETPDWFMFPR